MVTKYTAKLTIFFEFKINRQKKSVTSLGSNRFYVIVG